MIEPVCKAERARVLFVDDDPAVLDSMRRMLRGERNVWEMTFFDCPRAALAELRRGEYDTVVSDLQMPLMNGLQLLETVRQAPDTRDIPVIVLTGVLDNSLKRKALDLGATDLLSKPVESADLLARIRSVLRIKACQDELKRQNEELEDRIRRRTQQLEASRLDIIWRLGKAAESRDQETGNHILRVGFYSRVIATSLGLDNDFIDRIFLAAPLHDIGKLAVPDSILLKPGKLTESEWHVMQKHCEIGASILRHDASMEKAFQEFHGNEARTLPESATNPVLELATEIALTHHEKWNGAGYPHGLAGEEIPLAGRIVTVCDVYDAMTSERSYKPAFSDEDSRAAIAAGAGHDFDPDVCDAFERCINDIHLIRVDLTDERPGEHCPPIMPAELCHLL